MDYELAKKLKDAKYPQRHTTHSWHKYDWRCQHPLGGHEISPQCDKCYQPTLSELIEACGKPIMLLGTKDDWQAFDGEDSFTLHSGSGSSPEIAFANLWLELNKK